MASIFSRSLRKTAIETLNEIPRPIFNKDIDKYFETDDQSAASLSSLSDSKVNKTPFKTQKEFEKTRSGRYAKLLTKITLKNIQQFNENVELLDKSEDGSEVTPLKQLKSQSPRAKKIILSKNSQDMQKFDDMIKMIKTTKNSKQNSKVSSKRKTSPIDKKSNDQSDDQCSQHLYDS